MPKHLKLRFIKILFSFKIDNKFASTIMNLISYSFVQKLNSKVILYYNEQSVKNLVHLHAIKNKGEINYGGQN